MLHDIAKISDIDVYTRDTFHIMYQDVQFLFFSRICVAKTFILKKKWNLGVGVIIFNKWLCYNFCITSRYLIFSGLYMCIIGYIKLYVRRYGTAYFLFHRVFLCIINLKTMKLRSRNNDVIYFYFLNAASDHFEI